MAVNKHLASTWGVLIFWCVVAVAFIAGWVMNIIVLATETDTISLTEALIRIAGVIVAPFGGIMGYF